MAKSQSAIKILKVLVDGKPHTYKDISNKVGASLSTIRRCIDEMSIELDIVVTSGSGADRGVLLRNNPISKEILTCKEMREYLISVLRSRLTPDADINEMLLATRILEKLEPAIRN